MISHLSLSIAFLGAALGVSASIASAQPRFGLDGGVFFPSSSKTKRAFGSRFTSIGPAFGDTTVSKRKIYPDFDLLRQSNDGNRATVIFAGARLLSPIGRPLISERTTGFAPYAGFGLNLIYANIDAPSFGVDDNGFGAGASAILGASFGGRFFSEASYRLGTSAADFNFSGTQIVIGARF